MSRKTVHRVALAIVVLGLGGAVYGWWYLAFGKWAFAGEYRHDFGEVRIYGKVAEREHSFVLRNRRSRPVTIEAVRTSCGCTAAELSVKTVPPGEEVEIKIDLGLSVAGPKKASISLILDDGTVQMLWVEAIGLKKQRYTPGSPAVQLVMGEKQRVTVLGEIQENDDEPPQPQIDHPDVVAVTFLGWEQMEPRDMESMRPAKWRGLFELELLDPDGKLNPMWFAFGDDPPIMVRLSKAPPAPGE